MAVGRHSMKAFGRPSREVMARRMAGPERSRLCNGQPPRGSGAASTVQGWTWRRCHRPPCAEGMDGRSMPMLAVRPMRSPMRMGLGSVDHENKVGLGN